MRIAQISPLMEAMPPKLYGGTERVVSWLTEELVAMGHDVTLFASGDSVTSAKLAPMRDQAIRLDPSVRDPFALHYRMIEQVYRRKDEFDILHSHLDYFPLSLLMPAERAVFDNVARAARFAGLCRDFLHVPSGAVRVDLQQPAAAGAAFELAAHGAAWDAGGPSEATAGEAGISRVSGPDLPGERRR